jgi:DNA replication protein DnaC
MSTMIEQALKELHLPVMRSRYVDLAERARLEQVPHETYLHWLLAEEQVNRADNRLLKLIEKSRIPPGKNLDVFDMGRLPLHKAMQIKSLASGAFLQSHANILLFGTPGSGKTHVLCGIGLELMKRHRSKVVCWQASQLVQELLIAKRELTLNKLIKKLTAVDALIIDEFGYVQQTREEMECMFHLLAACYERTSVLVSSNLAFNQWDTIFQDKMMAQAAIDRLVHHSHVIEMNLPSYRHAQWKRQMEEGASPQVEPEMQA